MRINGCLSLASVWIRMGSFVLPHILPLLFSLSPQRLSSVRLALTGSLEQNSGCSLRFREATKR